MPETRRAIVRPSVRSALLQADFGDSGKKNEPTGPSTATSPPPSPEELFANNLEAIIALHPDIVVGSLQHVTNNYGPVVANNTAPVTNVAGTGLTAGDTQVGKANLIRKESGSGKAMVYATIGVGVLAAIAAVVAALITR